MRLRVKVNAAAQSESVRELEPGFYQVRTRAPAVDGKANRRVLELLAEHFGVEVDDLELVAGQASSLKIVDLRSRQRRR